MLAIVLALPWYLFSFGVLVIVAALIASSIVNSSGRDQATIDPDMDDGEILSNLQAADRVPWPNYLMLGGMVLVLISIVWRLLRVFF